MQAQAEPATTRDARWRWDGRAWVFAAERVQSRGGMAAISGTLGCGAFGVLWVVIIVGVLGMGDYPPAWASWVALGLIAVLSSATLAGTGWLIGFMNRRWWIKGSLIATWPAVASL